MEGESIMETTPLMNTAASLLLNERLYEICVERRTVTKGITGMTQIIGTIASMPFHTQMVQGKQLAMTK